MTEQRKTFAEILETHYSMTIEDSGLSDSDVDYWLEGSDSAEDAVAQYAEKYDLTRLEDFTDKQAINYMSRRFRTAF